MATIHVVMLVVGMAWAHRKSGFLAAMLVGVLFNASYPTLRYATFLYPDQTVGLYSLIAFVLFFSIRPPTKLYRPILLTGVFTAFACFSKAMGVATLVFFAVWIVYYRRWNLLKEFVIGLGVGTVLVSGAFTLLYGLGYFRDTIVGSKDKKGLLPRFLESLK